MDPLSTSADDALVTRIKEELLIDPEDDFSEHVAISKSVEIYVNDADQPEEMSSTGQCTSHNPGKSSDPLAPQDKSETEVVVQDLNSTNRNRKDLLILNVESADHFFATLNEVKVKLEDNEINIFDDQLDCFGSSPIRRGSEPDWLRIRISEDSEKSPSRASNPTRKSVRKRNCRLPNQHVADSDEDEVYRIEEGDWSNWSDDSDNDPDYSPLDEQEEEKTVPSKLSRMKNQKVKNGTYKVKKSRKQKKKKKITAKGSERIGHLVVNTCLFCNSKRQSISKHLIKVHSKEPEVERLISLGKGSKERRLALREIKDKGNSSYDEEADRKNSEAKRKRMEVNKAKRAKVHRSIDVSKKKIYKKSSCVYCKNKYFKISRHLLRRHINEPDVQHILTLEKFSKERALALQVIRNRGNFLHNKEVIAEKSGNIIPQKRQKSQNHELLPCNFCLAFYKKSCLSAHMEKCSIKINRVEFNDSDLTKELSVAEFIKNLFEEENPDIKVMKVKAKHSKETACYYCDKMPTKLMKHLACAHPEKPDVKYLMSLEKGSKGRYLALQTIRRKGNFVYNRKILRGKEGTILTTRTPTCKSRLKNFLPCQYCFGFFSKDYLIKHTNICHLNNTSEKTKEEEMNISEKKRLKDISCFSYTLLNCPTNTEGNVNKTKSSNKMSKIMAVAQSDDLIVKYGALLRETNKSSNHSRRILYQMRCLARLVVSMNFHDRNIQQLPDSLKPEHFKTVLKTTLLICSKFENKKAIDYENFQRVAIQHCCMIVKSESLLQNNDVRLREINDFLTLMKEEWSESILSRRIKHNENRSEEKDLNLSKEVDEVEKSLGSIDLVAEDKPSYRLSHLNIYSDLFYSKRFVCLFCNNYFSKLVRHWGRCHPEEPEVKQLAGLAIGSTERAKLIKALRNRGNYFHNKKVIEGGKGSMIRVKGQAIRENYCDYLPCEHCLGFFKANRSLNLHYKRCPFNPTRKGNFRQCNRNIKYFGFVALYRHKDKSELLQEIITKIKMKDLATSVLSQDELILKYGSMITEQKKTRPTVHRIVTFKIRSLAWLLLASKGINKNIKSFRDCLLPEHFSSVLEAGKTLFKKKKRGAEVYFRRLGFFIQTCCRIVKSEALVERNESKFNSIVSFMTLHSKDWVLSAEDKKNLNCPKPNVKKRNEALPDNRDTSRKRPFVVGRPWLQEELSAVATFFACDIKKLKLPGKADIEDCMIKYSFLEERGWLSVKSKVRDMIKQEEQMKNENSNQPPILSTERERHWPTVDDLSNQLSKDQEHDNKAKSNRVTVSPNNQGLLQNETLQNSINCRCEDEFTNNDKVKNQQELDIDLCNLVSDKQMGICINLLSANEKLDKERLNFTDRSLQNISSCGELVIVKEKPSNGIENAEDRTYLVLGSSKWTPLEYDSEHGRQLNDAQDSSKNSQDDPTKIPLSEASGKVTDNKNSFNFKERINRNISKVKGIVDMVEDSANENVSNVGKSISTYPLADNIDDKISNVKQNRYNKKGLNRGWTEEENEALFLFFKENIKKRKIPSKLECEECIDENDCLESRDWISVKSKIYNVIRSRSKLRSNQNEQPVSETLSGRIGIEEENVSRCSMSSDIQMKTGESDVSDEVSSKANSVAAQNQSESIKCEKRKRNSVKKTWSFQETIAIEHFFKKHLTNSIVPGKKDCEMCIEESPCLTSRSWVTVKSKVHNLIVSKRRKTNF